jgi:hypothetical protein
MRNLEVRGINDSHGIAGPSRARGAWNPLRSLLSPSYLTQTLSERRHKKPRGTSHF